MKRIGFLVEKIADTDNLLLAYYKASRGKQLKADKRAFESSLWENIARMQEEILSGNPDVGHYEYFTIHDPKQRLICAASFSERVLHHAIINVCHQYFERQLIETTYATRPGKGVYQALERAKHAAAKYQYVAKCDFKKYFDSIDHEILKKSLRRLFKDERLLGILNSIIESYSRKEGKGIPIGNLTSQYFANYYLSSQDHLCKEILGVKEYIRYMDDFLIFASSPEELRYYVKEVSEYSSKELALTLKPVVYVKPCEGIPFLGYKTYNDKILLNSRSKRRLKSKIHEYEYKRVEGMWSESEYMEHITPLLAFARYGYTKSLRRRILANGDRQ